MSSKPKADVLILAAGFGKRLRPLTETIPKPLVEVGGRALIEWNLDHIKRAGFSRVFVNCHYLSEKVFEYFSSREKDTLTIELVEESPDILDTGGAILNIKNKLEHDSLLTLNGDAMFDDSLDLAKLVNSHSESPDTPVSTMLLRDAPDKEAYGLIGFNQDGQVISFLSKDYFGEKPETELMYTGVQVLSREVFDFMPSEPGTIFSITRDTYPKLLAAKGRVQAQVYGGYFNDVGTPQRLAEVKKHLLA